MKVKIGQLKTHLSRYVRDLRERGEPIEVCVREQTVAYLAPAESGPPTPGADLQELNTRLKASGLTLVRRGQKPEFRPKPGRAEDGTTNVDSVAKMRSERDW